MPKIITLQLLVDDIAHISVDEAINDMMHAAKQPIDETDCDGSFIIDWRIANESEVCSEIADSIVNEVYQTGEAFQPLVITSQTKLAADLSQAFWNTSLGWTSEDLATRYLCPDDDDKSDAQKEVKDATFVLTNQPITWMEQLKTRREMDQIPADVISDDHHFKARFNANPWFIQASDEDILRLYRTGWGRSEVGDAIVHFCERRNPDIGDVMDYTQLRSKTNEPVGFECVVDPESAMAWLKAHRPTMHATILCAEEGVELLQAQQPEIAGRWDWIADHGQCSDTSFETQGEAALDAVRVLHLS